MLAMFLPLKTRAQVYSGSDGSDGALDFSDITYTTNIVIDMHSHTNGIYQYSYVNIPANVTVTFITNGYNSPVTWLVQSNVTINGTVSVAGQFPTGQPYPANPAYPIGGLGGPGGGAGGSGGGNGFGPGGGIGAGAAGYGTAGSNPYGGMGGQTYGVTVHDPILSEVTFGARRFKTASKDGLGFKGRRRGHWA